MRRLTALLTPVLLAACVETATAPAGTGALPVTMMTRTAAPTGGFGAILNETRARHGLAPATPNARLAAAAQAHADDMARQGYFSHDSLDGRSYIDRMRAAGHSSCYPVENLAMGQATEAQAVAEWMTSAGHRRNLLLSGQVEYGLGRAGEIYVLMLARIC